ncbi:hypothetical protein ACWDV4_06755 [Micromonospora sp. NPDC003197]
MTAGFSFDSDAVARVSRELAGIRSDMQPDWQASGGVELSEPKMIEAALQEFVATTRRALATVGESVTQVAKSFDDLVADQAQVDKRLADGTNSGQ